MLEGIPQAFISLVGLLGSFGIFAFLLAICASKFNERMK